MKSPVYFLGSLSRPDLCSKYDRNLIVSDLGSNSGRGLDFISKQYIPDAPETLSILLHYGWLQVLAALLQRLRYDQQPCWSRHDPEYDHNLLITKVQSMELQ